MYWFEKIWNEKNKIRVFCMSCVVERVLYSGDGEYRLYLFIFDKMKSVCWL